MWLCRNSRRQTREQEDLSVSTDSVFASVKGFNYQPGYGATGVDIWRDFRADHIEREIARGKELFPHINTIRVWLSFDAWLIDSGAVANLETLLGILHRCGLQAVLTLFNGWHSFPDFGGITPEHMSLFAGNQAHFGAFYSGFVRDAVGPLATDERVIAWDLCNEPFNCAEFENTTKWLSFIREEVAELQPLAPVGISVTAWGSELERVEPFSDVLMIHPYLTHASGVVEFGRMLDTVVEFAHQKRKPLLVTECCWGSLDDAVRAELVRLHLEAFGERSIGWLAHLLNHTLVADGHRPEYGVVTHAGYMAFVEADGSLRAHHGLVNNF